MITNDYDAGPAATRIIVRSAVLIVIGSPICILRTGTVCIKSNYIRSLVHCYKANLKTISTVDPSVILSARLLDLIALSNWDARIKASRRPFNVCQRQCFLRRNWNPNFFLKHMICTKFGAGNRPAVQNQQPVLSTLITSCQFGRKVKTH